jgi:hypothetical protein
MPVTGASSTYRRNRFCVPGEQPRLKKNGASVRVRRSRQCEANLPRKGRPFLRGPCRVKTTGTILPGRSSLLFRIAQFSKKSEELSVPSRASQAASRLTPAMAPAKRVYAKHSSMYVDNSGQHRLGEHRSDAAAGRAHCRGRCCTLLLGRRGDLEQSLPAEIRWKRECHLMLHHRFQNVRQTFRVVSIIKTDAATVKCGRRHPVLTSQKPLPSTYG